VITKEIGILSHLFPGDVVLASRGFNIQETSVAEHCAEAVLPVFTIEKNKLSAKEVL